MKFSNYIKYFLLFYLRGIRTPAQFIRFFAKRNAKNIVIEDGEVVLTMEEVNVRSNALANSLLGLGLKKGDKLGISAPNCWEFIVCRLAAYKAGFIFCALIDDFSHDMAMEKITKIKFDALITTNKQLIQVCRQLSPDKAPGILVGMSDSESASVHQLHQLIDSGDKRNPKITTNPSDITGIGFTSGTTGKSKGVVWDNKAWLTSFYHFLLNSNPVSGHMTMLQFIPFSTAGSLAILPWLASGGKMIIMKGYNAKKVAEVITRQKVTHMAMAPAFLIDLWSFYKANKSTYSLKSLESISVGSAALPGDKLKDIILDFGPIIQQSYGMAEVLAPLASLKILDPILESEKLRSVGKPIPQINIRLIEKNDDGIGKITVKSKTACRGYWTEKGLDTSVVKNSWFTTEDLGRFDREGNLYIVERKSNLFQRNGQVIFPRNIEELMHTYTGIKNVVVMNAQNKIQAYIVPHEKAVVDIKQLTQYCKEKLSAAEWPDEYIILDDLSMSSSGKLLRKL